MCRAEFGRIGGLVKYLNKIDTINNSIMESQQKSKTVFREYEKLIEMICFSCKESVNRLRLKELGHLVTLVKHQQSLKIEKIQLANQCQDSTQML